MQYKGKNVSEQSLSEINSTKDLVKANNNGLNDKFKSLSISPINQKFAWGKFGDFNIVMHLEDAYINGSVLLKEGYEYEKKLRETHSYKPPSLKKDMTEWLSTDTTQLLLETAAVKFNMKKDDLIFEKKGKQKRGEEMLQGIYLHPLLVNVLAEWVSPSYALIVSDIISDIHIKNKEEQDKKRTMELEETIAKKEYDLQDLFKRMDEQMKEHRLLMKKNKKTSKKLDVTEEKLKATSNELAIITNKLRNTTNYIEEKKREIRIPSSPSNTHIVLFYQVEEFDGDSYYRVYRIKVRGSNTYLKNEKALYKEFNE